MTNYFYQRRMNRAQRKKLENEMTRRQAARNFERYAKTLDSQIAQHKTRVVFHYNNGRRDFAAREARYCNMLTNLHDKVEQIRGRMEIAFAVGEMSDVMGQFSDSCYGLNKKLSELLDSKMMAKNNIASAQFMNNLDEVIANADSILDSFDFGSDGGEFDVSTEDDQLISSILQADRRQNRSDALKLVNDALNSRESVHTTDR